MFCNCTGCAGCSSKKCDWPWGKYKWQKYQKRCYWCAVEPSTVESATKTMLVPPPPPPYPPPLPEATPEPMGIAEPMVDSPPQVDRAQLASANGPQPKQAIILCDGLTDESVPLLKEMQTRMRKPNQWRICVWTQGVARKKQKDHWTQTSTQVLSNAFEQPEGRILSIDLTTPAGVKRAKGMLKHCNVFHMAGGNAFRVAKLWSSQTELLSILKRRFSEGEILYIGSSAGSVVAGNSTKYCNDEPVGNRLPETGLGLVPANISVYHSKLPPFPRDSSDPSQLLLGPKTSVLIVGDQGTPFFMAKAKNHARETCLGSPFLQQRLNTPPTTPPTTAIPPMTREQQPPAWTIPPSPPTMTIPPMTLEQQLMKTGMHYWQGDRSHLFHVQVPEASVIERCRDVHNVKVMLWIPGSGDCFSPQSVLARVLGRTGFAADAIAASCVLVSPWSRLRHKADVPEWIANFTRHIASINGGNVVLAGFSRGAKWCHEICKQLIDDRNSVLRCLLLAPYCKAAFGQKERLAHAQALNKSKIAIKCIYSVVDECCKFSVEQHFILNVGACVDASAYCPSHNNIITNFFSGACFLADLHWLLGTQQVQRWSEEIEM